MSEYFTNKAHKYKQLSRTATMHIRCQFYEEVRIENIYELFGEHFVWSAPLNPKLINNTIHNVLPQCTRNIRNYKLLHIVMDYLFVFVWYENYILK